MSKQQSLDPVSIHWFRQDLRLSDNPALLAAVDAGRLIPVYILDDENAAEWQMGGASRWWLHRSLSSLNDSLEGRLRLFQGDAERILPALAKKTGAKTVTWNRCYEPWRIQRDNKIKSTLAATGIDIVSANGSLLWEPWDVLKSDGTPYRVFTPFYRKGCLNSTSPRKPTKAPSKIAFAEAEDMKDQLALSDMRLNPSHWTIEKSPDWVPGKAGALDALTHFLDNGIEDYKDGRNFPATENCSRLSPHLHYGEISPHQVWYALAFREHLLKGDEDPDHFRMELAWREFSYNLLYHNPELPNKNLQGKFDRFPWRKDNDALQAWQQGKTGIPFVDAGMRELWQTGSMHNRVRMVTASFLVKNLMIDWREGERWFWDCLVDADLANNSASWQWVAGSGADAAPYFRIFNPATQGVRFDPQGEYTRKYLPELAALPDKWLFNPWDAPAEVLKKANVVLGETYPHTIADLKSSRRRALDAFSGLKDGQTS
ncbi:deoxyribodipyrimidine photo-lyase [uncultured Sneathiella sp.]|uniref:cryptochrome/photolyase family protein n=1 Tax=uncultured Sneathiella sp. TaxID=879315 RepID=UPI0030D6E356